MKKSLVIGVIFLFLGIAVQPITSIDNKRDDNSKQVLSVEPIKNINLKEYLLETAIQIVNNPDAEQLIKKYRWTLFNQNIVDDVTNIVINDKRISERISTLKTMNDDLNSKYYPNYICYLLNQIFGPILDKYHGLAYKYYHTNYFLYKFYISIFNIIMLQYGVIGSFLNC